MGEDEEGDIGAGTRCVECLQRIGGDFVDVGGRGETHYGCEIERLGFLVANQGELIKLLAVQQEEFRTMVMESLRGGGCGGGSCG
jgi:hypothetical protein